MDLFLFYILKGKGKIDAGKTIAVLVNFGFLKNIRTYFEKATYGPQNPVDGDKKIV